MSLGNFGLRSVRGILSSVNRLQCARSLYSASSLGIDGYANTRSKVLIQFENITEKFRQKMTEYIAPGANSLVFTEDLKHMLHLVDGSDNDISLIEKMILKFAKQNKEIRFGSFVFGPVVMRMFHHYQRPNEALKLFLDPDTDGFFDQLITYQVLMDLLYESEMYEEVLKVFDKISSKQLLGTKYPKNCVVIALATCYKMNNSAAFDYMKTLWSNLVSVGHAPMRRAATFAAGLAINQNQPDIAMEILTTLKQPSYVTVRNLKVLALAGLGRPEDTFPILRSVLEVDVNREIRKTFATDVIGELAKAVEKTSNKDIINEFERIEKQLKSNNHISDSRLESMLCQEIVIVSRTDHHQRIAAPFKRNFERNFRPGLKDML